MADDTEVVIPYVDGAGQSRTQLALSSSALLAVAPQTALRSNGAHVSDDNGLPTRVPPLAYSPMVSGTAGVASATLIPAGTFVRVARIQTLPGSTSNVWLRPDGGVAAPGTGVLVAANGGAFTFGTDAAPMPIAAITAITDGVAPQPVLIVGG
jgi:hypothetical protein